MSRATASVNRAPGRLDGLDRPRFVALAGIMLFVLTAGDLFRYTIGAIGFGVLAVVLAGIAGALTRWTRIDIRRAPWLLGAFLLWCLLSLIWSNYRLETVLGLLGQYIVVVGMFFLISRLTWRTILRTYSWALMATLGLSLLFELWAAAIVRHPIYPLWTHYTHKEPAAFDWSRAELFTGGQIQGVLGNSNLLAMVALLAVIVFGVRVADRSLGRVPGILWLAVAVLTLCLTRSSTVIVATLFTAVVFGFAMWMRHVRPDRRLVVYIVMPIVAVVGAVVGSIYHDRLFALLGKSDSLTGRTGIWEAVLGLIHQRPVFGWGWISYWAPWVKPFDGLIVRKGVEYLQAHDAWLDTWMQTGIIGLIIFALLVASAWGRSWFRAIDRQALSATSFAPYSAASLAPLLILSAMIAQSFTESRMLIEIGWALLVLVALVTRRGGIVDGADRLDAADRSRAADRLDAADRLRAADTSSAGPRVTGVASADTSDGRSG